MRQKKLFALLLCGVLSIGILAACGSKSTDSEGDGTTVIKIATQTPLSGGSAITGESIRLGAQMKLEEEVEKFKKLGYTLQLEKYDDQSDTKKGVSNANIIGADEFIYGVIGHYNSGVAIPSSEVYEK